MAVGGGDGGSGGLRQGRRGRRSRSSSPEVTSRPPCTLAGRGGRCRSSSLCEICKFKQVASSCEDGGGDGSESLGSDSNTIESSDDSSQRMPVRFYCIYSCVFRIRNHTCKMITSFIMCTFKAFSSRFISIRSIFMILRSIVVGFC